MSPVDGRAILGLGAMADRIRGLRGNGAGRGPLVLRDDVLRDDVLRIVDPKARP